MPDDTSNDSKSSQAGSIIVAILLVLVFLSTILLGLMSVSKSNLARARSRVLLLQAQYAAESGADASIAVLNSGNDTYTGTPADVQLLSTTQFKATYGVTVANGSSAKERVITAVGKVYTPATASSPTYTRTIRITAQRSSTTTASSMVSRNVVDIDSGVKNISGKDVYVNGFINMNKNTTNLIAENITVAGKNTGASNCSIGGTGNLVKPSTFTTPGQTKTNLLLAYNNCISPPGNSSNANFNVSVNQGTITTIQSMYIPWSQYMDATYGNAGSCNDWTTGASPRNIPNGNGSNNTHYPDSASNVVSTCGNSGSLDLGSSQYNIKNHVHIRADLCSANPCSPTFYNPDATTKFIFVEGTVNFDGVNTAAGSGPIVLVTYGTDPASKAASCPYGGSLYIGKNATMSAPKLYLLAMNGLCLDKTKFGATPALGGIAGKNLYVATNSGTPFDLAMDTTFPVSDIPIDLAWRAARYERL